MPRFLFASVVAILLIAISATLWLKHDTLPGRGHHLAAALPVTVGNWTSSEVPLGATEAVQGAVEKTLQFDDSFFREYRSANGVVGLYVAYWGPGKMPTQLVASHTPDRCWSESGWICEQLKHAQALAGMEDRLLPGEWRIFSAPGGSRLHVQYWHLVGGEPYDYGGRLNRTPSIWRWWRDAARQVFKAPGEQYFIRISSSRPFEDLAADPAWHEMLAALAKLGLAAKPSG